MTTTVNAEVASGGFQNGGGGFSDNYHVDQAQDRGEVHGRGGGGGGDRGGDWICGGCSNSNFAKRTECHRCKEPRTDGGGGGGRNFGPSDPAGFLDNDEGAPPPEKPKETYVPEDVPDEELFEFQINSGINFDKYAAIPVNVSNFYLFTFCDDSPTLQIEN